MIWCCKWVEPVEKNQKEVDKEDKEFQRTMALILSDSNDQKEDTATSTQVRSEEAKEEE